MILSTVPGMVVLGRSGIRDVFRFNCMILADLAMRGFAISFLTVASVALPDFFLPLFCGIHPSSQRNGSDAVQFRAVSEMFGGFLVNCTTFESADCGHSQT